MSAEPATLRGASMGPIEIVPLRRRHLRGVLRIEEQVYPRPWSLGLFVSELRYRESRRYVVARTGATVVGYGGIMLVGTDAHVTTIAVDPVRHRQSIGTRLMLVLAREARSAGATELTLEVRMSNDAARAMYQRFGFVPAGVRKNYYAEVNEDALVMWAHDVDQPVYADRLDAIEATLPTPTIGEASP